MNAIAQMMQQNGINMGSTGLNTSENMTEQDLIKHQEPVAAAMRALMKILEYEKNILPMNIFNSMVDSLKENLSIALDKVKVPNIPPMSGIVSVNGEPVKPVSGNGI